MFSGWTTDALGAPCAFAWAHASSSVLQKYIIRGHRRVPLWPGDTPFFVGLSSCLFARGSTCAILILQASIPFGVQPSFRKRLFVLSALCRAHCGNMLHNHVSHMMPCGAMLVQAADSRFGHKPVLTFQSSIAFCFGSGQCRFNGKQQVKTFTTVFGPWEVSVTSGSYRQFATNLVVVKL